jgi:hypothetical protein
MRCGGGRSGDERVARSVRRTSSCGGATWDSEWRRVEVGAHTPAPLHTLSARASVTTPATTNPSAPAASYSCQLTVSVSDSFLSVRRRFYSRRRHTRRWRRRLRCSGALLARRFPPRWVLLLSTHAPRTPSANRELNAARTRRLDLPPRVYEQTTHLSLPSPALPPELEQLLRLTSCVVSTYA